MDEFVLRKKRIMSDLSEQEQVFWKQIFIEKVYRMLEAGNLYEVARTLSIIDPTSNVHFLLGNDGKGLGHLSVNFNPSDRDRETNAEKFRIFREQSIGSGCVGSCFDRAMGNLKALDIRQQFIDDLLSKLKN